VAGCSNSSISSRIDLYDLLVNIPAREITVAPHAKGKKKKKIVYFIYFHIHISCNLMMHHKITMEMSHGYEKNICFLIYIFIHFFFPESLTMTKTHKEIALFMVQLCENQNYTEAQVISEISDKTQDLLNQLTSLATVQTPDGKRMISVEIFKEKNLAPAVENFLINLAIAENLFVL